MRLFLAVQLEQNLIQALTETQNLLRKRAYTGQYSKTENLHLTLSFIGEYPDPDAVTDAVAEIPCEPFEICLTGYLGNFGNLIWAGTDCPPALAAYVKRLRHALAEARIPFDKKKFSPHITLLRNARSAQPFSDITVPKARMTVCRISVMRSDFGRHGAVYSEVGAIELS